MNKYKLINDPVHGFITVSDELMFEIIEQPVFQRLRRINQMGLANFVYPGTQHTRFHHALGATHLMQKAIETLRKKGIEITAEEESGALAAILLHDIGHGAFSHALEYAMIEGVNHEFFSEQIMQKLNKELNGRLDTALAIFNNKHPKTFLHQLVSGQLDVDRLDYLARDSFFSGVYEGKISTDRIISMLNVVDNELVVEEKGLYSIEKYIISRRLMYWQVYLHKAAVGAEEILVSIIQRAKHLVKEKQLVVKSDALNHFLTQEITREDIRTSPIHLENYIRLDDSDIWFCIKDWQYNEDRILSFLCTSLIERNLFKVHLKDEEIELDTIQQKAKKIQEYFQIKDSEVPYLLRLGTISNTAYKKGENGIKILTKSGKVKDLAKCSGHIKSSKSLTQTITKHFIVYPKAIFNIK